MLIEDLPIEIQEVVFKRQKEQGNTKTKNISLDDDKSQGNFNWYESIEGLDFWKDINHGDFTEFYKKYPKEEDESLVGRYIKALIDYPSGGYVKKDEIGLITKEVICNKYCVDFPSQKNYIITKSLNTDIYKLLPKDYKPIESKPMTYEHSPFPTDGNYFKAKVIKDIIRKDIGTKGSLPDIIRAGSITWFNKYYDYYNVIKNQENNCVCPENNRYSANIPAEYFEIIEDESKTEGKSEIKLEKDKYYRLKFDSTFFIDKIKSIDCNEGTFDSYGYIDINRKNWINPDECCIISDVKECHPATEDEIAWWNICHYKNKYIPSKEELIEEAKKKYPIGTKFYPAHLGGKKTYCTVTTDKFRVEYGIEVNVYALTKTRRVYSLTSDEEYTDGADYNRNVFSAGKWADIVKEKSVESIVESKSDYIDVGFKIGDRVIGSGKEGIILGFTKDKDECVIKITDGTRGHNGSFLEYWYDDYGLPINYYKNGEDKYYVSVKALTKLPDSNTSNISQEQYITGVDPYSINPTTSNQSFLIYKSKNSLDTTVQKVSEISIELKQKSKTIKF
jgi:hypothetical protein